MHSRPFANTTNRSPAPQRIAAGDPCAIALEAPCGPLSYGELNRRADELAGALRHAGVSPGALVAVCLPRSHQQIAALLAAWRAGAAYLPLDPAWPDARLAELIARAGCAAVIAEPARAPLIMGTTPAVDPAATGAPLPAAEPTGDDLAYVIYTSGSTGEPKAVEVTHANLAALIDWHCAEFAVGPGTRTSHLAGLGFDAAAWEVWPTLCADGTLCLPDAAVRLDPVQLRDWLVADRIEVAFAPTALAEPLVGLVWPDDAALRVLLTGADKLTVRPPAGLRFAFVNNYGPTECTVVATSGVVAPVGEGLPPIGRAIAGTTILLLDPAGASVAEGTPGEIHIGGAQVARGYRGDAALTAARFIDHPQHGRLYRTGDLAFRLDSGELAFLGRVDGQVKVRGHRIEPAEVTAALHRLPDVAASHVAVREGELVAWVVPAANAVLTASALRTALAASLPDYMIPAQFAGLAALPLTPHCKVDIAALPAPAGIALPEAQARRAPATPTEQRLFGIVADVLGRDDFGTDDDFFLVGGHSLLGTQVIVRSREAFGIELSLLHLFEAPRVADLAAKIEDLVIAKIAAMSDEDIRRMSA